MARSNYEPSLGANPSKSISVTSMDDPPPPPPPRQSKSRAKRGGQSFETSPSYQSEDVPQSRYEEDSISHDYSHDTSISSRRHRSDDRRNKDRDIVSSAASNDSHQSRLSHNSFSAPPPPPPPGQPPVRTTSTSKRNDKHGLSRIPESDDVSQTSRPKKNVDRDDVSSSPKNQKSRRDEKSVFTRNTRDAEMRDNRRPSRDDTKSIDTEVLRYGHDGTNSVNSTGKESVAARRRKKAQEATENVKPATSKKVEQKRPEDKVYDDPPLELYSESESDDSKGADAKKKKKKSGFSKVKKFIRMGNKSPKKKNQSPGRVTISPGRGRAADASSPKKKKSFLSRMSLSPGKRRSLTPENRRGREVEKEKKTRTASPFNFRSRSRSRSKSRARDLSESPSKGSRNSRRKEKETTVARSAEIVVNKEKLAENEKKLDEQASRDEEMSRASARSAKSYHSEVSNARSEKKESTFEKLRREREEKRKQDLEKKKDDIQDSDFEIISGSHSDDVSEVTDPTYMTREARKKKSPGRDRPAHDLDVVEELSSPENSPRNKSMDNDKADELDEIVLDHSRSKSPESKSTYHSGFSKSKSLESKDTKKSHHTSQSKQSKHSRQSQTSRKTEAVAKSPEHAKNNTDDIPQDNGDSWNLNSFDGKENFVATIDPFQKASRSTDPFDQPFYPTESEDEPRQMFSFVYSESDAELDREGMSKDTLGGLSFDSEDDRNSMDGLSYATPAAQSDATEVVKNSASANARNKKPMLPPSSAFVPDIVVEDTLDNFVPYGLDDKEETIESSQTNDRERPQTNESRRMRESPRMRISPRMGSSPKSNESQRTRESPRMNKPTRVLDSFLGIDENSGAVTMNVRSENEHSPARGPISEPAQRSEILKMQMGKLSERALSRPKKNRVSPIHEEKPGKVEPKNFYPKSTTRHEAQEREYELRRSLSPERERSIHHSPSFIIERREKRKQKEADMLRKANIEPTSKTINTYNVASSRGKGSALIAIERGRRREQIFGKSAKSSSGPRTYSPAKMKFALNSENVGSPSKVLANSTIRSPKGKKTTHQTSKSPRNQNAWIEKPHFDTRKNRTGLGVQTSPSPRTAFKAPAVFGDSPREGRFKAPEHYNRRTDPVLASVAHIEDPIQRAGAMILSAAAIPIQAEMRRYLAVKEREDRAWGVVVIQTYFRRWKAELTRYKYLYCATRIQSAFRGWLVRDTLEDKNYCATQIQKIARGYLATMSVYENLYNITVVQSIARRNAAIRMAEDRYRKICVIQGLWRGKQCRRELHYLHWTAQKIQTTWRGYTAKLSFQFDIVDIIIVQSIARRRAAIDLAHRMRAKRVNNAATVIQKSWRSYDCTMNYLHAVADVLIAQSVVRRWIARRYVSNYRTNLHFIMSLRIQMCARSWMARTRLKKEGAAREIQKVWRGFWGYTGYVFTLADIIIVQKTVRAHQARKTVAAMAKTRNAKNQYEAAVMIQKTWRGYSAQMEMLFNLVHIIIVQSIVRRRIAIIKYKPRKLEHRAAIKIQNCWRTFSRKRSFMENYCATIIQTEVRRYQGKQAREEVYAARKLQAWYRSQSTSRGYLYYMSARKIQTVWRGYDARKLADEERWVREYAATTIQKSWRMFYQYSSYAIYKHEKKAATDIQRHWRGFWDYSHFVIMRYEASKIQAVVRGTQQRKRLGQQHEAAVTIQAAARCILAKKTCHMERLFSAMIYSAQLALSQRIAARKIQTLFRYFNERRKQKRAALVIERFFIWVRAEVEREIERRERQRIKKRQEQKQNKKDSDILLEDAYRVVNVVSRPSKPTTPARNGNKSINASLRERMISSPHKPRSASSTRHSHHAVDVDDTGSDVSGLTNPSESGQKFKLKKKGHLDKVDDDLEGAWHDAKRKQKMNLYSARPKTTESQKENSSTFTPDFKVSARSLSRNREELRRARG